MALNAVLNLVLLTFSIRAQALAMFYCCSQDINFRMFMPLLGAAAQANSCYYTSQSSRNEVVPIMTLVGIQLLVS